MFFPDFSPKTIHFPSIFRSIFHVFSGTPLGWTFSRFWVDFYRKSAIWEPFWDPAGLRNQPLGRHFPPKSRLLSYTATEGKRLLGDPKPPSWRSQIRSQIPSDPKPPGWVWDRIWGAFWTNSQRFFIKFGIDFVLDLSVAKPTNLFPKTLARRNARKRLNHIKKYKTFKSILKHIKSI